MTGGMGIAMRVANDARGPHESSAGRPAAVACPIGSDQASPGAIKMTPAPTQMVYAIEMDAVFSRAPDVGSAPWRPAQPAPCARTLPWPGRRSRPRHRGKWLMPLMMDAANAPRARCSLSRAPEVGSAPGWRRNLRRARGRFPLARALQPPTDRGGQLMRWPWRPATLLQLDAASSGHRTSGSAPGAARATCAVRANFPFESGAAAGHCIEANG